MGVLWLDTALELWAQPFGLSLATGKRKSLRDEEKLRRAGAVPKETLGVLWLDTALRFWAQALWVWFVGHEKERK